MKEIVNDFIWMVLLFSILFAIRDVARTGSNQ